MMQAVSDSRFPGWVANPNGVFILAWSGTETETGAGTGIMQNISHYTGTRTGTGTGRTLFACPK